MSYLKLTTPRVLLYTFLIVATGSQIYKHGIKTENVYGLIGLIIILAIFIFLIYSHIKEYFTNKKQ
ncbi:hypothetical protein BXY82_3139 [Gelidibacter sediminis]|uniref:Uncharacterized protein n=1 Tax=Gelidibacter sediminis TaxID=1608710 RepID=A0A4R7PHM1_9FLAO|nr:hypothetical protein BXY82_3139 [Gelidibacter sediminis]